MSRIQRVLDDLANSPSYMVYATLHNMRLVAVNADEAGTELLHVESEDGERAVLRGAGKLSEWRASDVGKIGVVGRIPAHLPFPATPDVPTAPRACYFRAYIDQSLRRAPELDFADETENGGRANVIGWRCDAKPMGFRAPLGLTPGEAGCFVADWSVSVTLRVPAEFVRECERYGMTPAEMLQGFACDAAGIMNHEVNPRADGLSSNGSDERDMADDWMQRAYFGRMEDAENFAAQKETIEEKEQDRVEVGYMLDDWLAAGGEKDALIAAVEKLIVAKRTTDDIEFNPMKAPAADGVIDIEPTGDDAAGMAWWDSLSESERFAWLQAAESTVPADAWATFKLNEA